MEYCFWQDSGVFTKQENLDSSIKDYMARDDNSSKAKNELSSAKEDNSKTIQNMKLLHDMNDDDLDSSARKSRIGRRKTKL
jgi:hypothetical protein